MALTFLGTSSGGGPTEHRNCSSLIADVLGNGELWMVDCAEGTTRQFAFIRDVRPMQVNKIFITHMHVDHIMGIIGFLRNVLFPKPVLGSGPDREPGAPPRVHVYGPAGIRAFIRNIFTMTASASAERYAVHELLRPGDPRTSCDTSVLHESEAPGSDIPPGEDGLWRDIVRARGTYGDVVVDVAPIAHRVPSFGYVFSESAPPLRKIVILGDTSDPTPIIQLCSNPPPSVLVHEATDAHIPPAIDRKQKREPDVVLARTLARGHSIPAMAGAFARVVGAERLVLNHIGGRFPFPDGGYGMDWKTRVMAEFERQATDAWKPTSHKERAIVASDFMHLEIPPDWGRAARLQRETGVENAHIDNHIGPVSQAGNAYNVEFGEDDVAPGLGIAAGPSTNRGVGGLVEVAAGDDLYVDAPQARNVRAETTTWRGVRARGGGPSDRGSSRGNVHTTRGQGATRRDGRSHDGWKDKDNIRASPRQSRDAPYSRRGEASHSRPNRDALYSRREQRGKPDLADDTARRRDGTNVKTRIAWDEA